jgi:hypothetical protein
MTKDNLEIYIALLNENVNVWRPVKAKAIKNNIYLIVEQPYDSDIETWEFKPGEKVLCKQIESNDGKILAAVKKIE